MGVQQDNKTVIAIDSSKGIDGSTSITEIPNGYCDLLENADISTKGVIKKRAGYGLYGCQIPARTVRTWFNWTSNSVTPFTLFSTGGWAYSSALGILVFVDSSYTYYTTDGTTWSRTLQAASLSFHGVAWGASDSIFVAVGYIAISSTLKIYTSSNGVSWSAATPPVSMSNRLFYSIAYGNGVFVAVGDDTDGTPTDTIMTSPDGIVWTARTHGHTRRVWTNIVYASGPGFFMAFTSNANTYIYSSDNGVSWTEATISSFSSGVAVVAWSEELSVVCAIGAAGKSVVSTDGLTWKAAGFTGTARGLEWVKDINRFVVTYYSAPSNYIAVSADGLEWVNVTTPNPSTSSYHIPYMSNIKRLLLLGDTSSTTYYWDVDVYHLQHSAKLSPALSFYGYNDANVATLIDGTVGYQLTRDLGVNFVIVKWTDQSTYEDTFALSENTCLRMYVSATSYSYPVPIAKVLSKDLFVITAQSYNSILAGGTGTSVAALYASNTPATTTPANRRIQFAVGPTLPYISEEDIESVTDNATTITVVFKSTVTDEWFQSNLIVGRPITVQTKNHFKTTIVTSDYTTRTITMASNAIATVIKNYLRLYLAPTPYGYVMAEEGTESTVKFASFDVDAEDYTNPRAVRIAVDSDYPSQVTYGLGVDNGNVQSLSSYKNLIDGAETLVTSCGNIIYRETATDNAYIAVKNTVTSVTPTSASAVFAPTTGGTVSGFPSTAGTYYFTLTGLGIVPSEYEIGDVVYFRTVGTDGAYTEYSMTVMAVSPNLIVSYQGTSLTVFSNVSLVYRRTSRKIPVTQSAASGVPHTFGCIGHGLQVDSVSNDATTAVITYVTSGHIYVDKPVTFYSDSTLYANNIWEPVLSAKKEASDRSYTEVDTSEAFGDTSILSTVPFSGSAVHTTPSKGLVKITGTTYIWDNIPKPEVVSIRSIPGTKGVYPITRTGLDKRIGVTQSFVLTYGYVDEVGRLFESRATDIGEVDYAPNPTADGADFAEYIEMHIKAPPVADGVPIMRVRIYRKVTDEATNTDLDYRLEKIVVSEEVGGKVIAVLGDVQNLNPASRPRLYTLDEGNNIPAPRCKYLMSAGNRLVGLNIDSAPYVTIEPVEVFNSTGTNADLFSAFAMLGMFIPNLPSAILGNAFDYSTSNLDYRMLTTPFGFDKSTGAMITGSSAVSGWPGGFPAYSVLKVTLASSSYATTSPTLTYLDNSHLFDITSVVAITATKLKLRGVTQDFPRNTSIDFEGDVFEIRSGSGSTALKLAASTKWDDTDLTATGVPRILNRHRMAAFAFAGEYNSAYQCFITALPQVNNSSITLNFSPSVSGIISSLLSKHLVIHGPGTLGTFKDSIDGRTLNWENDLIFVAAGSSATASWNIQGVDTTYATLSIYPRKLKFTTTLVSDAYPSVAPTTVADVSSPRYTLAIFTNNIAGGSGTAYDISAVSGFSNPSNTLRITNSTYTIAGVGDHLVLDLADADKKKIPPNFPRVDNVALEVTGIGSYFDVRVKPTSEVFTTGVSTSVTTSSSSTVVCTENEFPIVKDATAKTATLNVTVNDSAQLVAGRVVFLIMRGYDFNSTCFDLSGWWYISSTLDLGATNRLTLVAPYNPDSEYSEDIYSKLTSVSVSYLIVAHDSNYLPIPVPVRSGLAENLYDTALPMFTSNELLTNSPLVQVAKRFSAAFRSFLGALDGRMVDCSYAYNAGVGVSNGYYLNPPPNAFYVLSMLPEKNVMMSNSKQVLGHNTQNDYDYAASATSISTTFPIFTFFGAPGKYKIEAKHRDSTTGLYSVSSKYSLSYTRMVFKYRIDSFPNSIAWTAPVSESVISNFIPSFKERGYHDLGSQDDTEITGGTDFQTMALITKKNSLWRLTFGEGLTDYSIQKLQSTVGSLSHNNLPKTDTYCYFLHTTGVYYTDGTTVEPVFRLNKTFDQYVTKNETLFSWTAGYTDPYRKNVFLGIPYNSPYSAQLTDVDGQYNYSYNDGVLGWQINTRIDALKWHARKESFYFASTRGMVCKIREDAALSRYHDYDSAIPFVLRTRYLPGGAAGNLADSMSPSGAAVKFKFWRNAIFQFGNTSDFSMAVYYMKDYRTAETPLVIYTISGADETSGDAMYGTTRHVKTLRDTIGLRLAQVAFVLREESDNTDSPVHFVGVEGLVLNTALVPQKDTRSSDR